MDCTFAMGRSRSTSAIALRIVLTRLSGSTAVRTVIVIACTPPPAASTIGRYRNCSAAYVKTGIVHVPHDADDSRRYVPDVNPFAQRTRTGPVPGP